MSTGKKELTHNGKKIVIEGDKPSAITIDDESIPVRFDDATGRYIATTHSPYTSFDNLADLAKHVADHVIGQRSN